jgi:hypothetical protein
MLVAYNLRDVISAQRTRGEREAMGSPKKRPMRAAWEDSCTLVVSRTTMQQEFGAANENFRDLIRSEA